MVLTEVPVNSRINIEVTASEQVLQYQSLVVSFKGNRMVIDPIIMDGMMLSLSSSPNISIDLIYTRDDESPVIFENVHVSTFKYLGKIKYLVQSFSRGKKINRRGAPRMFLGIKGNVQLGINRSSFDVVVKDISQTGFAFAAARNVHNAVNTPVKLRYLDGDEKIDIVGEIVRKTVMEEKKIIYGCQILINKDHFQKYVLRKEKMYKESLNNKDININPKKRALMRALKER